MIGFWSKKNWVSLGTLLLAAVCSHAADTKVVPFVFGYVDSDFDSQNAEWQKLIKYKLWGTGEAGQAGVLFNNQDIHINDSLGYSGSAAGDFVMRNDKHDIGGPLAFGGGFLNDTGTDSVLTGPSHFGGTISIGGNAYNSNNVTWRGYVCSDQGYNQFERAETKGNATRDCSHPDIPEIDKTLDVPTVDYTGDQFDAVWPAVEYRNKIETIDIPEGEGYYDIHVEGDFVLNDLNDSLYIRIPNGRVVRIFIDGELKIGGAPHNIVTMNEENAVVSNKDYAGNILFYSPNTISFPAIEGVFQGTYISGGTIKFMQHYSFSGQLLAKNISIDAHFKAGDFRYVPFNASKVVSTHRNLREDHETVGDDIQLTLDKASPTKVPFRYCFEFFATDPALAKADGNMYAHRTDLADADIPVCSQVGESVIGDFASSYFEKGETSLANPIVLHAAYDALSENKEGFRLWVCDLEAAIYPDGDRSGNCHKYDLSITNIPKNPLGKDFVITGFMNSPLVLSSFPAMYPDSTELTDYSVMIVDLPTHSLTLNGEPVKAGDVISVASLGGLKFTGALDEFGAPYDSLTYKIVKNEDGSTSDDPYRLTINLASVMFDIKENSLANDVVGQMENGGITKFEILDATQTFVINSTTGKITVKADSTINYEATPEGYYVSVVVTKGTSLDTVGVQINVIDVNEPPTIRDTSYVFGENQPVGSKVGTLPVYDEDNNKDFLKNMLSLIGGDTDKYAIEASSGVITSKVLMDYEDDKYDTLVVLVKDPDNYTDTATVIIEIGNVMETSKIEVPEVAVPNGPSHYNVAETDTIYINKNEATISWTADGIPQPDTTVKNLHEGLNVVVLEYCDKTKDKCVTRNVYIYVCTRTPQVDMAAKVDDIVADNIFTIVEQIAEDDTSFYVKDTSNKLSITVRDPIFDATYTDSTVNYSTDNFTIDVKLKTLSVSSSTISAMNDIAGEKLMLNDAPSSKAIRTPYNDSLVLVTYTEKVKGKDVLVSYVEDSTGKVIGNEIAVSYKTVVNGDSVTISYRADALTGEPVKTEAGETYMVSYEYTDKSGKTVNVAYGVDSKGKVVHDAEDNVAYEVTYTYTSSFGNKASRTIRVVLDVIPPKVEILDPEMDAVLFSNFVDVKWTVDKMDGKGAMKQDTLNTQGLERGANTIVRFYKDKAGNKAADTVYVVMKDAKDVNIAVETPVTLVTKDKAEEYYSVNPPQKDQTFAVTILNPKKGTEIETLIGGDFKTKKGSEDVPYPGLDGHLGPTLTVEAKVPVVSAVSGLATLDDLLGGEGLVNLDGVDAAGGEKMPVDEYVEEHCSDEFRSSFNGDASRASLYHTVMKVKIWVFTTLGSFVDYFTFEQELDNPDYVNEAGMLNLYFEMKPDKNGDVRTASGRLYGTGAYLYKTEVSMKATLQCDLPPLKDASSGKIGAVRKVSEDMLKPFGYKRPDTK